MKEKGFDYYCLLETLNNQGNLDNEGNIIKGSQSEGLDKTTTNIPSSHQLVGDNSDLTCDRKHYNTYNSTCGDTSHFSGHHTDDNSSSTSSKSEHPVSESNSESKYQNESRNEIINPIKVRGVDYYCLMETLKIVKDFVDGKMLINGSYIRKNFD